MRILFLIRSLDAGGAERQLVALANQMAAAGHEVHVALFYGNGILRDGLAAEVRVHALEKRGRWDILGFVVRWLSILRRVGPEVVHGYLTTSNLFVVLARLAAPRARIVFGLRASNMDLSRYDWLARAEAAAEARLSRCADLAIANSKSGADYAIRRGFRRAMLRVVPNGIDTARFQPDAAAGSAMRQRWGLADDALVVGLAARLDPMKDHANFFKAAAQLRDEFPGLRLVCIGGGNDHMRRALEGLASELGLSDRVVWAGVCQDMCAAYNTLDLAVSASLYGEGFSNALAEAQACGVPCVATDVGDSALIVGDTGKVVAPGDPAALAAALRALLGEPAVERRARGARARARICDNYSLDMLCQRTEQALAAPR